MYSYAHTTLSLLRWWLRWWAGRGRRMCSQWFCRWRWSSRQGWWCCRRCRTWSWCFGWCRRSREEVQRGRRAWGRWWAKSFSKNRL